MKTRRWVIPSALVLALALSLPAYAQRPASLPIKQGFEAAWARQPEYRGAALRRDAAAAGELAAQRWTPEPPALELTAKSDGMTTNTGAREYEARVAVPIWLPNERSRSLAAASAESIAVDARLFAVQWRVAAEVRDAYWAYQRARLDRSLAEQRRTNSQQLAADVARRVQAGDLARADSHQAEAAAAAAQSAVAESGVALTQTAQRWTSLTGTAPPGEDFGAEATPSNQAFGGVHPLLRDLTARADVAKRQLELAGARSRANPEVMVGVTRERADFNERYAQVLSLAVRFPLGKHSGSDAKVATAGAEQVEAETQLLVEQERVRTEVEAARERVEALATVVAAAERRRQLALESRGFFEKSFRLGETDLPTRLRIELEATDAERQATRSRIEHAAAVSQLRQSLGLLPD
jgi:cobalt-zinc-cadmium efflux system outer membrane protein